MDISNVLLRHGAFSETSSYANKPLIWDDRDAYLSVSNIHRQASAHWITTRHEILELWQENAPK
jgi:hypothetical protein